MATTFCAACGRPRLPGELLLVADRRGIRPSATICRPGLDVRCLRWAGPRSRTAIGFLDDAAARIADRDQVSA